MRAKNRGHLKLSVEKLQNKIFKSTKTIMDAPDEVQHLILVSLLYPDVFYSSRNNPTINDWILELEYDEKFRREQRTGGEMVKGLFMENITPMIRTKIIDGIRDYMDNSSIKKLQKQINQIGEIIERSYYI